MNNNKKKLVALTGASVITLLIASIVTIGSAPFSSSQSQQPQGPGAERAGPRITSTQIVDETIVSDDLRDGEAVMSTDIVDGQVDSADLTNDAVTSGKISDGEVTTENLADGAVTPEKTSFLPGLMKHVVLRHDSEGESAGWRTNSARHIITDPDVHGTDSIIVANVVYPPDNFIGYNCFVTDLIEGSFRLDCNSQSLPDEVLTYLVINPPSS